MDHVYFMRQVEINSIINNNTDLFEEAMSFRLGVSFLVYRAKE